MGFLSRLFRGRPAPSEAHYDLEPSESSEGRGFVVRRLEDDQRLRWQTLPKREGLESIKIVGVSYRIDALQDPSFAPGQWLALVPEPENPHDANAVSVWNADRTLHVGYLPRESAPQYSKRLQRGETIACVAVWETRSDGQRVALRALMLDKRAKVRGIDVRQLGWQPGS